MKLDNYFTLAKTMGFEALEIVIDESNVLSFSEYNHQIEKYCVSSNGTIYLRGIIGGKVATGSTEEFTPSSITALLEKLKENAAEGKAFDSSLIYYTDEKYKKKIYFNKDLYTISVKEKQEICQRLEDKIFALDQRITDVEVSYDETIESKSLNNSKGLSLKGINGYYVISASVVLKVGETSYDHYIIKFGDDPRTLDLDLCAKILIDEVKFKVGAETIKSGKYNIALTSRMSATLLSLYLQSASGEEVLKETSMLNESLNKKVMSSKLSIKEVPTLKNIFCRYFDDEGVATVSKDVVKKGVLQIYAHSLETAKKMKTTSTGNGYKSAGGISPSFVNLVVKGGKNTDEEILAKMGEGVLITSLQGLHSGLNKITGDFSLQAQGKVIKNGVISQPVTLITLSGNLKKMFESISDISKVVELQVNGVSAPLIAFKKMSIGGK